MDSVPVYIITERGNSYAPIMEKVLLSLDVPYELVIKQVTIHKPQPIIDPVQKLIDTMISHGDDKFEMSLRTSILPKVCGIVIAPDDKTAETFVSKLVGEFGPTIKQDVFIITLTQIYGEIMADTPNMTFSDWNTFYFDFLSQKSILANHIVSTAIGLEMDMDIRDAEDDDNCENIATFSEIMDVVGDVKFEPKKSIMLMACSLQEILLDVFGDRPENEINRFLRKALSVGILSMSEEAMLVFGIDEE
jgi:hypothetical protein